MAADDNSTELLPLIHEDEPIFDVGIRGYNKRQVDSYVVPGRGAHRGVEGGARRGAGDQRRPGQRSWPAARPTSSRYQQQAAKAGGAASPIVHVSEQIREMLAGHPTRPTRPGRPPRRRRPASGGPPRKRPTRVCVRPVGRRAGPGRGRRRPAAADRRGQPALGGGRPEAGPGPDRGNRILDQAPPRNWTRRRPQRLRDGPGGCHGARPLNRRGGRRPGGGRTGLRRAVAHRRGGLRDHPAGPGDRRRAAGPARPAGRPRDGRAAGAAEAHDRAAALEAEQQQTYRQLAALHLRLGAVLLRHPRPHHSTGSAVRCRAGPAASRRAGSLACRRAGPGRLPPCRSCAPGRACPRSR